MIYCKFKLLQANEDVRRETGWCTYCNRATVAVLCSGGETTWQTAPTKQNEISNNSEGKFLQYDPPQIISQSLRNSVMHLVAHLHFARLAQHFGGIGFEHKSADRLS